MARGRKRGHGNSQGGGQTPKPQAKAEPRPAKRPEDEVDRALDEIMDGASDEDLAAAVDSEALPDADPSALAEKAAQAVAMAKSREARYEDLIASLEARETAVSELEAELERRFEEVETRATELAGQVEALEQRTVELTDRASELQQRDEKVSAREAEAETGFLHLRQELFEEYRLGLKEEADRLRKEQDALVKSLSRQAEQQNKQHDKAIAQMEGLLQSQQEAHATAMEKMRAEVHASEERADELRRLSEDIEFERKMLKEDEAAVQARAEKLAAAEVAGVQLAVDSLNAQLAAIQEDYGRVLEDLSKRQMTDRRLLGMSPEQILAEREHLIDERDELAKQLAARPDIAAVDELGRLREEREEWVSERGRLLQANSTLKTQLSRAQVAVNEREDLQSQVVALESSRDLLGRAVEELRQDVDERIRRTDGLSPFPSCTEFDGLSELQQPIELTEEIPDLVEFAESVRQRIAAGVHNRTKLYYTPRDVRSFIGGLSMTQLHLLHGISGTGKSSLPAAFAKAIGAGYRTIEVQAGWRDRYDLIGHYNSFEKKFYESEFLQALYRASCPRWTRQPYFIVLEEMNLSHPEQYFADMLDNLEKDPSDRRLILMTQSVESAPLLMSADNGRSMPLPKNAWFVGTANQDETTKDFAEKTYDRAHIMELPDDPPQFVAKTEKLPKPFSMDALEDAFAQARKTHPKEKDAVLGFLSDAEVKGALAGTFRLGWGPRLKRHLESYAPVVVAAGGSRGEVVDHILETRLLRKLRDRHDNQVDDLTHLMRLVDSKLRQFDPTWMRSVDDGEAEFRSMRLLQQERHRVQPFGDEDFGQ